MSVAATIRRRVDEARPGSFFHVEHEAEHAPRRAVETAFFRLAREGKVIRARKGLYWRGYPSRFGTGAPSPLEVALEVLGPGTGPTGWAATNVLGISTQVPPRPELVTLGPVPMGLEPIRVRSRRNEARRDLRFLEIAVLEALRDFPTYAETDWLGFARALKQLATRGEIDLEKVRRAVRAEPSRSARRAWVHVHDELQSLEHAGPLADPDD